MSHTLQYASSRAEIWRFYWRAWARPKGLWIHHVFIGLCVALLTASAQPFDMKTFGLRWAIATFACLALLPLWPQLRYKSAVRSLTVDTSGYQTTIGKRSGSGSWSEIDRIEDMGKDILMVGKNGNAMVIPERAFRSTEERAAFLNDAKSWHHKLDV
jgi:hypothetical protein